MEVINSEAQTPPSIKATTFNDYSAALFVPQNSIDLYQKAKYWENFTQISTANNPTPNTIEIKFNISNNKLEIKGIEDSTIIYIYTESGIMLYKGTVTNAEDITLPKGIYIIRIGDYIKKVMSA